MPGEIVPFVQFPALDVQDMINPVLVVDPKDTCRVAVLFSANVQTGTVPEGNGFTKVTTQPLAVSDPVEAALFIPDPTTFCEVPLEAEQVTCPDSILNEFVLLSTVALPTN